MKQLTRILFMLTLMGVFLGLTACSATKPSEPASRSSFKQNQQTSVIDLKKLQSIDSISNTLSKHRSVFVGETHTAYADHLNQLAVIKNIHQTWKKNLVIGLEMVQQPFQRYLDDYIAGKITEREMLKGVEWYDRWRYDFRLYRPIFDYAKKNQIPLLALNIPKEITRRITKVGIKGLSAKQRKYLPAYIDRSDKNYIKRIGKVFGRHSTTQSKGLAKFLDAQLGWDEGMAYAAANYLKKHPTMKMLIIAGGGHIISGEGIPNRLDRMLGSKSAIVLNSVNGALKPSLGDFLLDSPEKKLPPIGRIGIAIKDTSAGVKISRVSVHGAAKKAGIHKGDLIVSLANSLAKNKQQHQKIRNTLDVRLFMEKTKPADLIKITLKRKNKIITKTVKLGGVNKLRLNPHRK